MLRHLTEQELRALVHHDLVGDDGAPHRWLVDDGLVAQSGSGYVPIRHTQKGGNFWDSIKHFAMDDVINPVKNFVVNDVYEPVVKPILKLGVGVVAPLALSMENPMMAPAALSVGQSLANTIFPDDD